MRGHTAGSAGVRCPAPCSQQVMLPGIQDDCCYPTSSSLQKTSMSRCSGSLSDALARPLALQSSEWGPFMLQWALSELSVPGLWAGPHSHITHRGRRSAGLWSSSTLHAAGLHRRQRHIGPQKDDQMVVYVPRGFVYSLCGPESYAPQGEGHVGRAAQAARNARSGACAGDAAHAGRACRQAAEPPDWPTTRALTFMPIWPSFKRKFSK